MGTLTSVREEEIFEAASKRIANAVKPVIACGHFKLRHANAMRAYADIYQDLRGTSDTCQDDVYLRLEEYCGNIPYLTFEMGVRLVKAHPHAKILILVNDQDVTDGIWHLKASESIVLNWYKSNQLEQSFRNILDAAGLSTTVILQPPTHLTYGENSFYFSETQLIAYFNENLEFHTCSTLGHVCAQEQMPKYDYLVSQGYDHMETFFPQGCGEALFEAKLFSRERYPNFKITHHYCKGDLRKEEFWDQVRVA